MNSGVIESPLIADEKTGIILDGRGRPFNFKFDTQNRKELIDKWRSSMNEYPILER